MEYFSNMVLLLLTLLISSTAAENCNGIYFNNMYYNIEILREGVPNTHQIVFNNNDNTLYFTFDQLSKIPTRALAFMNLDTKQIGLIDGIRNATSLAIDHRRNRVYVGGSDGLYFLNDHRVPEKLPVNENIRYLFYKDVVYFINNWRQAYKFEHGAVSPLAELSGMAIDKIIADDDNNLFFLQNRKLSKVKIGTRIVNTYEGYIVDAIGTDINYKPYISSTTGVYAYNKYKYALDKVSDIIDLRELTFNRKGEAIYVVVDHIVKLRYNEIPCYGD